MIAAGHARRRAGPRALAACAAVVAPDERYGECRRDGCYTVQSHRLTTARRHRSVKSVRRRRHDRRALRARRRSHAEWGLSSVLQRMREHDETGDPHPQLAVDTSPRPRPDEKDLTRITTRSSRRTPTRPRPGQDPGRPDDQVRTSGVEDVVTGGGILTGWMLPRRARPREGVDRRRRLVEPRRYRRGTARQGRHRAAAGVAATARAEGRGRQQRHANPNARRSGECIAPHNQRGHGPGVRMAGGAPGHLA